MQAHGVVLTLARRCIDGVSLSGTAPANITGCLYVLVTTHIMTYYSPLAFTVAAHVWKITLVIL